MTNSINALSPFPRTPITLTFCRRILILLVFAHQVVHVRLSLGEFLQRTRHCTTPITHIFRTHHLVHAFACVPMQESLATEHRRELLGDALEQLLDRRAVAYIKHIHISHTLLPNEPTDECRRHLQTTRWNVAHGGLDVVRNPFDEVRRVLVLHVEHLLVDFLHRHATAEDRRHGQISAMARIARGHHVLRVEHLLCELGHSQRTVLLRSTRRERREAGHEEVETRKRNHVHRQLA